MASARTAASPKTTALLVAGRLSGPQQTAVVFGLAAVLALAMAAVLRQALAGQPFWPG